MAIRVSGWRGSIVVSGFLALIGYAACGHLSEIIPRSEKKGGETFLFPRDFGYTTSRNQPTRPTLLAMNGGNG
jgi:hypothetical protein